MPYNTTGSDNCTFFEDDFELELDTELYFGFGFGGLASDKVYGKIFINDTNITYTCLTYVATTDTGQLIQTNPPYTQRVVGLIQVMGKETEDREFFTTQNGLSSVYWTDHNLVIDGRQYKFGVECSGGGNHLKSEQVATVLYKPVNAPITRWFWFGENVTSIFLGFLILVMLVFVVGFLIYALRGR